MNVHQFDDDEYSVDTYGNELPPRHNNSSNNLSTGGNNNRIHPLQSNTAGSSDQKMLVDIDAFSSDAEKLSAILKVADVEHHQHQLAIDYFRFRKMALFIPTVILSLIISVAGFVAASDITKDHMKVHDASVQDFLTLIVASFGFLVLIFTILGNGLDYNSKIGFHSAAAEDLAGLCDKVRLYRMERAMDEQRKEEDEDLKSLFDENDDEDDDVSTESDETERPTHENQIIPHTGLVLAKRQMRQKMKQTKQLKKKHEKLTKTLVKQKVRQAREEQELSKDVITFYGYHTELHQITRGCRSDIPPQISKFFHVMENRVELMSLSRLGVEEESRMRKNQIVRLCASEIYNEISDYAFWPLSTPSNVDRTIEDALKHVGQLLNMSYRGQRRCKLIPCCPIPLCCKKSKTSNVFAIINEGIDQRELDMMQAERVELVKMENAKRARRAAGPEEVVEMKDTLYSSGNIGDGVRDPNGSRAPSRRTKSSHPDYYASSDHSRQSKDPDGQTDYDMATEASFSFKASNSANGGYASHHYSSQGGGGASRGGGSRSLGYPKGDDDDDDFLLEDGKESLYGKESVLTEETGTFAGESYRSKYDEEEGTYRDEDEGDTEEEDDAEAKKKSKKKKKKKSKKKKKKAKKKKAEEEYDEEEFSDGGYSDGFTEGDEYSEYSELE